MAMDKSYRKGEQDDEILGRIRKQVARRPRRTPPSPSPTRSPSPIPSRSPSPIPARSHSPIPTGPIILMVVSIILAIAIISVQSTSGNFVILHEVPEGHVGVYWRGGALTKTISNPGFHLMVPFITKFEPIQVTLQTKLVSDVPCGTTGGVMISFDNIEVVNRLKKEYVYDTLLNYGVHYDKTWIYDKIHHEINQFCSSKSLEEVYIDMFDQIAEIMKEAIQRDCNKYAPGIEIISVRVPKPNIPATIRRNFELLEEERTKPLRSRSWQRKRQRHIEKYCCQTY
ncbi:hypothetical protein LUZ60_008381 [Juncus effusus]|nr:hypothetical protein LUZ60_008381 [Juncus effusus]